LIVVTADGILIDVKLMQPQNAYDSIEVTVAGIVIDDNCKAMYIEYQ